MTKCWLHGETAKEKSAKPLKEHPGHPDTIKENFQQNLTIMLEPSEKTYRLKIEELEEDFQQKDLNREKEKSKLKTELEQEISQWEINFQHLQQVKDGEISTKDARIKEQAEKIKKAVEILERQKKEIDKKQKDIQKLEVELKNTEPKDNHVYEFITHLQKDLKSELANKKLIEEQVKDLEKQQTEDKLARDKEIEELKKTAKINYENQEYAESILSREIKDDKGLTGLAFKAIELIQDLKSFKDSWENYFPNWTHITLKYEFDKLRENSNKAEQKIKQLTEVKMAREKSEERLKKQSEDFANVMKINHLVNDILGEYSDKKGLLLRSQEVVQKLKEFKNRPPKPTESKETQTDLTGEQINNAFEILGIKNKNVEEQKKSIEDLRKIVGEWKGKSSTADINLNNIKSLLEQKEKELEKLRTENQKQAEELLKKSTDPEIERNKIKEIILTDKWQKILGNKGLEEYEKLTTLNCQGNQLTSLPTLPSSLTTLDCSYNNLTTLPTLPSSLTTLALDFNSNPFIIDAGKFLKWDRYNLQLYLSSTINKIKVINCSKRPDTFQIWIDEKRDWKPWKEWAAMPEYKDWILP